MVDAIHVSAEGVKSGNVTVKMIANDNNNGSAPVAMSPKSRPKTITTCSITDSPCKPKHRKLLPGSPKLITSPRRRMKRLRKQQLQSLGGGTSSNRGVSFNAVVHNRRIPQLSESETCHVWITNEEYLKYRKRCAYTLKKMMKNEFMDEKVYCTRGLEGKTKEGAARRKENKFDASAAVLEEQSMQKAEGVRDFAALRDAYLVYSGPCQEEATQKGAEDEVAVKDYLNQSLVVGVPPAPPLTNPLLEEGDTTNRKAEVKQAEVDQPASSGTVKENEETTQQGQADSPPPLKAIPVSAPSTAPSERTEEAGIAFKLKDIFCSRKSYAAVLKDIERNVLDGRALIEPRKPKTAVTSASPSGTKSSGDESTGTVAALTSQLRDLLIPNKREASLPELEPLDSYDEDGSSTVIQNSLVW